jgi:hypothetical protein
MAKRNKNRNRYKRHYVADNKVNKEQPINPTLDKYNYLLNLNKNTRISTQANALQLSTIQHFQNLKLLRENFVTNSIYDIIKNEVFSNSVDNGIKINMKNKRLEAEANWLIQKEHIINFLLYMLPELLHYGSFSITPHVEEGVGLLSLSDEYEPGDVIEILDTSGKPLCYFVNPIAIDELGASQKTVSSAQAEILDPDALIYISLNLNSSKLYLGNTLVNTFNNLSDDNMQKLDDKVKVRISSSLLDGNINKLEDLLLLDKVTISKDIANLISPTVVGVPLPQSNTLTDMVNTINKLEEVINGNRFSAKDVLTGATDIEEISRVKFVPITDGKGSPQTLDTAKDQNTIEFDKFKNHFELFLLSIGIPPDLILGSTDADVTKSYVRYSKLIKRIASLISNLIKKILVLHFNAKYNYEYKPEHFEVIIRTNSNLDTLEYTEAQELLLASTRSLLSAISDMENIVESSDYVIDSNSLIENFTRSLTEVGSSFGNIFKLKEPEITPVNNEETEDNNLNEEINEGGATANLYWQLAYDKEKLNNDTDNKSIDTEDAFNIEYNRDQ